MSAVAVKPLKLAVKYEPPVLALVYSKGSAKRFIHEFELTEEYLMATPEDVLADLMQNHPGYLDKVNPEQAMRLISMVQEQYEVDPNFDQQGVEEYLQEMRSKMSEQEYEEFVEKLQRGELQLAPGDEYGDEEDEFQFNDRMQRDDRRRLSTGSEDDNEALSAEDFGF